MNKQIEKLELLKEYMAWRIDRLQPMVLAIQLDIYGKRGYWERGYTKDYICDFDSWIKIFYPNK